MPALYPMMSAPEAFERGECVRKFVSETAVTPYIGVVTKAVPSTYKVWVQWPTEHTQEDPERLIKVNPAISGLPTVTKDMGYDSYEKRLSSQIPQRVLAENQMAIRVAHTFATSVVGKLVNDISECYDRGLNDIQAYNDIYQKYGTICSDYIIRSSIEKIYTEQES